MEARLPQKLVEVVMNCINLASFADDLILFGEASIQQARVIKGCLERFWKALGQKISLSQSQVFFSYNTTLGLTDVISQQLEIHVTSDLGWYLGMLATNGRITKQTFAYVSDGIDKRVARWITKTLSLAGRATLVQSTIFSVHYYSMQFAKLPCSLCDEDDWKARKFLWGGNVNIGKNS